jgi:hypothetical protein
MPKRCVLNTITPNPADSDHLDDPDTVVISDLFMQAWGRRPERINGGH